MGEIWRALDRLLDRPVAVKLLRRSLASDPKAAARFKREALTAAGLTHPNIAEVYDYIEEDDRPGIVMELIEGEDLARLLVRAGPLPPARAIAIAAEVLDALDFAHQRGVVHRDIKPANILLTTTGAVKVADFGIARAMGESSLTATGTIMGTAHYSAPEQVRGERSTPTTDLYALGIVLYEMLSGRRPFQGETPIATATARLTDEPRSLRDMRPSIPVSLAHVVERAMAREPVERFASAAEMRHALTNGTTTDVLPVATGSDPTMRLPGATDAASPHRASRWRRIAAPMSALVKISVILAATATLVGLVLVRANGPDTITVPDLIGKQLADARAIAENLGLSVESTLVDSGRPAGTVLRQDVAPAIEVRTRGTTITLTVSDGTPRCCDVPDVVGMDLSEAKTAIEDAGLSVGTIVARLGSDKPDGTVVDQNPREGIRRNPDDPVDLIVARDEPKDEGKPGKAEGRGKGGGD